MFCRVGLLKTLGFQEGCLYVRPSPDSVYVCILSGRFLRAVSCREPAALSSLHLTHTQIDTSCMNGGEEKKKEKTSGYKPWRSERAAPPRGLPHRAASPALCPAPRGAPGAPLPGAPAGGRGPGPAPAPARAPRGRLPGCCRPLAAGRVTRRAGPAGGKGRKRRPSRAAPGGGERLWARPRPSLRATSP